MSFWKCIYFCIIFLILTIETHLCELTVATSSGIVEGFYLYARNGVKFVAFEGIPYAKPPVNNLRFQNPQPIESWNTTLVANKTVACVHYDKETKKIIGQEDCLVLNIYTPKVIENTQLFNVIVFIHGGIFLHDAGYYYRPDLLLQHNIVYVSFNYRLGALGFLSTENEIVSGNNGLKDQVLALKWIKENIQKFGGNPKSITLTGFSAGSASVTYHYFSPLSVGLFNRAIGLSGTCLSSTYLITNPLRRAKLLAARLDCSDESIPKMVNCLQNQTAYQIVEEQHLGVDRNYPFISFGPVVENVTNSESFLLRSPWEVLLFEEHNIQDLPLLLENVKDEGLSPAGMYIAEPEYLQIIDQNWVNLAPIILSYNDTISIESRESLAQEIRDKYLLGQAINNQTFIDFVKILTDRINLVPMQETVTRFSHALNASVYYNFFTYRGEFSNSYRLTKDRKNYGVCHGDDLQYILPRLGYNYTYTRDFDRMSQILIHMWLNFASTSTVQIGNLEVPRMNEQNRIFNFVDIASPFQQIVKISETLARYFDFWLF